MAVSVNFGTTTRDNRWIDKDPTWSGQKIACDIYEPTDRLNPVLIVDNNTTNIDIKSCNYMQIPEFGRYYFITDIAGGPGKRLTITGHVDVLMTYDAEIRRCKCIAERSTNKYNFYLNDPRRLFNAYPYNDFQFVGGNSLNADVGEPSVPVLITVG